MHRKYIVTDSLGWPWLRLLVACASLLGMVAWGQAQASVNVTNYGAKGDLVTLAGIRTVNNSTSIVCPTANFAASDINKVIEIFGAGRFQNISNETLFAFIASVSSPSNATLTVAAGATLTNARGVYATDSYGAFTNAIARCAIPTDTIIIPAGNYLLLPRELIFGYSGDYSLITIPLYRGGITFAGQGNATLTGCGGWRAFAGQGHTCQRAATFGITVPYLVGITNDHPLVFSNLTMDGGVDVGNIHDLSWPTSGDTGIGWDGTHHWLVTGGSGDSYPMVSSIVMQDCTVAHWRGEMMAATEGSPNLYLTASNCFFYDGNGSAINNFAHNFVSCTFSNLNQAEEYYRSYTTNASFMTGCSFFQMNAGIALNGGLATSPPYIISGNMFTNTGYALLTMPAQHITFVSNTVYGNQGIGLGGAGAQFTGTNYWNKDIRIGWNLFSGCQYAFHVMGNYENSSADVHFFSNQVVNAWGMGGGWGWSTNVVFSHNVGVNCGRFDGSSLQGQYFLEQSNRYTPISLGDSVSLTNIFTYAHGAQGNMANGIASAKYGLDNTKPAKIPVGATMTISNISSRTYPLYSSPDFSGTPVTMAPGQAQTFYWIKPGNIWTTNRITPPSNLRPAN